MLAVKQHMVAVMDEGGALLVKSTPLGEDGAAGSDSFNC